MSLAWLLAVPGKDFGDVFPRDIGHLAELGRITLQQPFVERGLADANPFRELRARHVERCHGLAKEILLRLLGWLMFACRHGVVGALRVAGGAEARLSYRIRQRTGPS